MRRILVITGILLIVGCSSKQKNDIDNTPQEDLADIRGRWNSLVLQHPDLITAQWVGIPMIVQSQCPEAGNIFESLYQKTVKDQYKLGRLYLEVVDEQGNRLNRVKARVRGIWGSAFRLEPNVSSSEVVFDGEIILPWTPPSFCIEVDLHKRGYRNVKIDFTRRNSDQTAEKYSDMSEYMCSGYVYPPLAPGSPIRVVMPTLAEWSPPLPDTVGGTLGLSPDIKKWPIKITGNEPVLSSTDDPKIVLTPVRGTYVITDRNNSVVEIHQADKGSLIGFHRAPRTWLTTRRIEFRNMSTGSLSYTFGEAGYPYSLRLYSEAKPIPPPPEPPAPPTPPKPAKGTVVADD